MWVWGCSVGLVMTRQGGSFPLVGNGQIGQTGRERQGLVMLDFDMGNVLDRELLAAWVCNEIRGRAFDAETDEGRDAWNAWLDVATVRHGQRGTRRQSSKRWFEGVDGRDVELLQVDVDFPEAWAEFARWWVPGPRRVEVRPSRVEFGRGSRDFAGLYVLANTGETSLMACRRGDGWQIMLYRVV